MLSVRGPSAVISSWSLYDTESWPHCAKREACGLMSCALGSAHGKSPARSLATRLFGTSQSGIVPAESGRDLKQWTDLITRHGEDIIAAIFGRRVLSMDANHANMWDLRLDGTIT